MAVSAALSFVRKNNLVKQFTVSSSIYFINDVVQIPP